MKKIKLLIFGGLAAGVVALIVVNQGAQGDKGTTVRIETVGRENLGDSAADTRACTGNQDGLLAADII